METVSSLELVKLCSTLAISRGATDLSVLDLRHIEVAPADFFLICTGNSGTNAKAIADKVREGVSSLKQERPKSEGEDVAQWIILDFFDVVVHIFQPEQREFYKVEKAWADGITYSVDANGIVKGL